MKTNTKPFLTRRSFLEQTAASGAVLAVPFLVPSSIRGAEGQIAPGNRITLGFIGTGDHGLGRNRKGFLDCPDAQVLGVCDVDAERRESAKKLVEEKYAQAMKQGTYKGCASYNDFREVIVRKDIDAVMVSTPDHWHVIPAIMAAQSGSPRVSRFECCSRLSLRRVRFHPGAGANKVAVAMHVVHAADRRPEFLVAQPGGGKGRLLERIGAVPVVSRHHVGRVRRVFEQVVSSPAGRKRIAHRFIGGGHAFDESSPVRDDRTAGRSPQFSAVPDGTQLCNGPEPSVETPGYCRTSLRDWSGRLRKN